MSSAMSASARLLSHSIHVYEFFREDENNPDDGFKNL